MHLQSENSLWSSKRSISVTLYPHAVINTCFLQSVPQRLGLCWLAVSLILNSKLDWNGQFKKKKNNQMSLSIFHHKICVCGILESIKCLFLSLAAEVAKFWCLWSVRYCPAWWQCCTSLRERGAQQCPALLSIPGWALLGLCNITYSRSSCDNIKNGSAQLKTCLHYSMCCVKAGLCLPCTDEFFLTMLYRSIVPWRDTALQGRTIFGDYISSVHQANPTWIDMGFVCLALCMHHKNLRQLHIELENFTGKKTSSQLVQEATWDMSSVFVNKAHPLILIKTKPKKEIRTWRKWMMWMKLMFVSV